jgi:hypothetical protein
MEQSEFWDLMEELSKTEKEESKLIEILSKLSIRDIVHFESFFYHFTGQVSGNDDIWRALNDGGIWASDDGYHYFTAWLVSRGKEVFDDVMKHPKKVVYYTGNVMFAPGKETLFYISSEIGEQKVKKLKEGKINDETSRLPILMSQDCTYEDLVEYHKIEIK